MRTLRTLRAIVFACLALPALPALAAYPDRPITMVVPFPAGGPTDLVARVLARQLTEQMHQTVLVENKGGANGNIGMQFVAAAKPDGYTILYNTSSIALSPNLYRNLGFNPAKDFVAVSTTATIPLLFLVNPSVPVNDLASFADYARKHPGMSYGSGGAGNITHLGAALILRSMGIQATHVPYRGSAPAMADLTSGQVQFMTNTLNDSLAFVRSNKLKALAISSLQRSSELPNVPTLDESGFKGFEMGAWQGVVVPAGTPAEIVKTLNSQIRAALRSDLVKDQLRQQGAQVLGSTPEEYQRYIDDETKRWGQVIRDADVRLD